MGDVLCRLLIALRYLFLAKLVSRLSLAQQKRLIFLPVALESLRDLVLAGLNPAIPIRRQFQGLLRQALPEVGRFPIQNRFQDGLPCYPLMSLITLVNWIFICVIAF